jgi:hypothetical protein
MKSVRPLITMKLLIRLEASMSKYRSQYISS